MNKPRRVLTMYTGDTQLKPSALHDLIRTEGIDELRLIDKHGDKQVFDVTIVITPAPKPKQD